MNFRMAGRTLLFAATGVLALGSVAVSEEVVPTTTTPDTTTTDTPSTTEDAPVAEDEKSGPGAAVSADAQALKDVDGPRKDAAKALRAKALANNPGYQAAVAKRAPSTGEEADEASKGKKDDHPGKDDHPDGDDNPGNADHPDQDDNPGDMMSEDHPDEDSNPGDLASEDHGKPDDLPGPDERPGADDHPTGRPGGG